MAVYDCTLFFNELDILLLRLVELFPVVDRFVVVEANRTFQGQLKPIALSPLPAELEPFRAKIEHVVVDTPAYPNAWLTEYFVRDAIMRGLGDARPDDVVLISDVDEVPRRAAVSRLQEISPADVVELRMTQLIYGFNWQDAAGWGRARAIRRSALALATPHEVRAHPYPTRSVPDAGWHFTNFFPRARQVAGILDKMRAVSHTELIEKGYDDPSYLELCVRGGSLWSSQPKFSRPLRYRPVVTDSPHALCDPDYADRFRDYVTPESSRDRVAERQVRARYSAYRLAKAGQLWERRMRRAIGWA